MMPPFQTKPPQSRTTDDNGVFIVPEGDGNVWLWCFPELLRWPKPITWLFAPATSIGRAAPGNRRADQWPGDLWGVDASGELVVVEGKRIGFRHRTGKMGRRTTDPMQDFVVLEHAIQDGRRDIVAEVAEHWRTKWAEEQARLSTLTSSTERAKVTKPGVAPYGGKRDAWYEWPALHGAALNRLRENYEELALAALERLAAGYLETSYVAFVTLSGTVENPHFSRSGRACVFR